MSAYLIVNATPNYSEMDAFKKYTSEVIPILTEAGGLHLKRVKIDGVLSGSFSYQMLLFMEFPNVETINAIFQSDAYKSLIPHRDKGFAVIDIASCAEL